MQQEMLRAEARIEAGTRPAKRLRRSGRVPAVVYGRGLDTVPVSVDSRELSAVLRTDAGFNALINVEVEGADTVLTVAREVQRDPVRGAITHLDFIMVSLDVEIEAEVAIDFMGTPVGIKDGGFVETIAATIMIHALPTAIPSSIEIDISELDIGDTIKVSDLPDLEGVEYLADDDAPLASVVLPAVVEEPEPEELLEGEDGEEGVPTEEGAAESAAGPADGEGEGQG